MTFCTVSIFFGGVVLVVLQIYFLEKLKTPATPILRGTLESCFECVIWRTEGAAPFRAAMSRNGEVKIRRSSCNKYVFFFLFFLFSFYSLDFYAHLIGALLFSEQMCIIYVSRLRIIKDKW